MSHLWPDCAIYISEPPSRNFLQNRSRKLAIMGSTGSIGRNALKVASKANGTLQIAALAAGRNMRALAEQANLWRPPLVACIDMAHASILRPLLAYEPQIMVGEEGYAQLASHADIDCVLSAQAGSAGLGSTLAAAYAGKVIALANKESLVVAGSLLKKICAKTKASILPVDSEHYAIFQCLAGRQASDIRRIVLTASGGPFLGKTAKEIFYATPQTALKHPNWNMGAKITIDSATLMNKGLEVIEAMHLYGIKPAAIRVLVHPQSIIHSLVEFADSSQLAQLAMPDMRLPIGGCLLWPDNRQSFIEPLDLATAGALTFLDPDLKTFPCLGLAMEAGVFQASAGWRRLGLNPACIALNAANETAVELYLQEKCAFGRISDLLASTLNMAVYKTCPPAPALDEEKDPVKMALAVVEIVNKLGNHARDLLRKQAETSAI